MIDADTTQTLTANGSRALTGRAEFEDTRLQR
jgi:hypothetical protein